MKKITPLLLGILLTAGTAGAQKNTIQLAGTAAHLVEKKLFMLNGSVASLSEEPQPQEVVIDSLNHFTVTIAASAGYDWIVLGNQRQRLDFMAKGGAKLALNFTKSLSDTNIVFSGKGNEVPNFFVKINKDKGGIMNLLREFQQLSELSPEAFIPALDSLLAVEQQYFDEHKGNLPKDFQKFWQQFLMYGRYNAMLNYPVIHEMIRQKSNNIRDIPLELYAVSAQVPEHFDDAFLGLSLYQSYATAFFPTRLSGKGFTNQVIVNNGVRDERLAYQQTDSVLQLLYQLKKAPKTAALVAGRVLLDAAEAWPDEALQPRVADYMARYKHTPYAKELEAAIAEATQFNPGKPAPDFEFNTLEGAAMKLSDLKGKVVYLDFWASWCGPCKREMPYASELKAHFKDKDVVFLYVSIDEKEEAWIKGIEAMNISGVHTRTSGWGGDLAKLYRISSVPAYFLIDKRGNLVFKQTPRPSQKEQLISEIERLLQN